MAYTKVQTGAIGSNQVLASNVKPDVEKVTQLLEPYQTPLMQWLFLSNKASKVVKSAYGKFDWYEDELVPHQTTIKVAVTASSGLLSLTTTNTTAIDFFNVGDIVLIEDTDQMAVVQSNDGTTVVLKHIDGSTALTSISTVGSYLKILGSENDELNGLRTPVTTQNILKTNNLNIFTEVITTSGREQAGEYFSDGLSHAELVAKRLKEMKLQAERYMLFSLVSGNKTASNGQRVTWGKGILGTITTNISTYSGALTETVFDAHLKKVFAKGSNNKVHLCGGDQLADLNKFLKDKYQLKPDPIVKIYGVDVNTYITPFGTVSIVYDPIFDGKFSKYGFTLDEKKITGRFMDADKKGSRKFRIEENVQIPGTDGMTTKVLMDIGIQLQNEECHGILKGS